MRILFLSNYYPPFARGGYEQWCNEVAIELSTRGHQLCVLTSRSPNGAERYVDNNVHVHRLVHFEVEAGLFYTAVRLLRDRKRIEQENLDHVRKLVDDFQPDVALIWGMWNIPRSVPALVERLLPGRVAYYLCDYWLSLPNPYIQQWQTLSRHKLVRLPKQLISKPFLSKLKKESPVPLNLEHPICVSQAVQQLLLEAGVSISHARVIYGGTQVEEFLAAAKNGHKKHPNELKLIYVGRLVADKGVHTIVEAMKLVVDRGDIPVTLSLIGKGDSDYEAGLKAMVAQNHLDQVISFYGRVPREEIPATLAQHDTLIFSSEWEEPFARTVLEAMAAGLAVIGTTTGGTSEILIDGETGLTFLAGDAQQLADQICRLLDKPTLKQRLATAGQQCVMENFTLSRMVNEIETILKQIQIKKEVIW